MFKSLILVMAIFPITSAAKAQDDFSIVDYVHYGKYDSANRGIIDSQSWPGVVLMGNSITEGWVSMRPDFFKRNNFIGRGISGQVSHQMLLRFQSDVVALKPEMVVILAGTNDLAQNSGPVSLDQIIANIKSMVNIAMANDIQPVLCSVIPAIAFPWRPGIEPAPLIAELNTMILNLANQHDLTYVDYHEEMVDDQGGLKVPDFTTADDLVHPNVNGYIVMEDVLLKALNKE